ncbi:MAG TPA: helix-turn-helix transcriptional regulator [Arachnia sp.]|nr:helix-turn-helix transcriptional regulator [Arachnia sp.]HMR13047.1 helix-turn-helix transcriptional regulator [Arachnia sp.]
MLTELRAAIHTTRVPHRDRVAGVTERYKLRAAIHTTRVPRIELARAAGVSTATMQRRLTGKGRPFLFGELVAICPLLGMSIVNLAVRAEVALEAGS